MLSLPPLASVALDNGVARTPPMGWMTWERFRCTADGGDVAGGGASQPSCAEDPENCISERLVRQHAEIMARPEWRGAGYEYLNIDDCWENWSRSPGGKLAPNSTRFPHGMRALADYVHSLGLKLGTYNDMGTETCGGYPGECKDESCSLPGYMGVDAATYAGWGIDSLKMDGCHSVHTHGVLDPAYRCMGEALNRTGRPVLYSCSWPDYIRTAPCPRLEAALEEALALDAARGTLERVGEGRGAGQLHRDCGAVQHVADVQRHPGLLRVGERHRRLGWGPAAGRCSSPAPPRHALVL